jgi:hypothetical protein
MFFLNTLQYFILYGPCIILQYIYIHIYVNQPDTQRFMFEFIYNTWRLNMFRASMVHPQERLQALCCEFGMWFFAYYSRRSDVMRLYNRVTLFVFISWFHTHTHTQTYHIYGSQKTLQG